MRFLEKEGSRFSPKASSGQSRFCVELLQFSVVQEELKDMCTQVFILPPLFSDSWTELFLR